MRGILGLLGERSEDVTELVERCCQQSSDGFEGLSEENVSITGPQKHGGTYRLVRSARVRPGRHEHLGPLEACRASLGFIPRYHLFQLGQVVALLFGDVLLQIRVELLDGWFE